MTTDGTSRPEQADPALPLATWVNANAALGLDIGAATLTRLKGGNSNVTYLLTDSQVSYLIRRPPVHALDASAHSMKREWQVLNALRRHSSVPVATPYAHCEDLSVIGAEFLVLEYIPKSASLLNALPPTYPSAAHTLSSIGFSLMEVLSGIQAVDWRASGLADFGRPDGFLPRQVPRWEKHYRKNQVRHLPDFERVTQWLASAVPPGQPPGIMHGDFHLDNCLFATDEPRLLAVVDWEMATIGDPLLDLGLCLALWGPRRVPDFAMPAVQGVSRLPGAPDRDELASAYAESTGRDISRLVWYEAFALWKLGAVIEAAWAQHVRGELRTDYSAALEHDVPALFAEAAALAASSAKEA